MLISAESFAQTIHLGEWMNDTQPNCRNPWLYRNIVQWFKEWWVNTAEFVELGPCNMDVDGVQVLHMTPQRRSDIGLGCLGEVTVVGNAILLADAGFAGGWRSNASSCRHPRSGDDLKVFTLFPEGWNERQLQSWTSGGPSERSHLYRCLAALNPGKPAWKTD